MSGNAAVTELSIIVAMDRNRVIGRDGDLPWRLPEDLKQFKRITMGKPVILGRKTHQSIGRALPGRRNLVLSRSGEGVADDCECFGDLESALAAVAGEAEAVVIGGAAVYAEALPLCRRLYLTEVDAAVSGDTYFPEWDPADWTRIRFQAFAQDGKHAYSFVCSEWIRKREGEDDDS